MSWRSHASARLCGVPDYAKLQGIEAWLTVRDQRGTGISPPSATSHNHPLTATFFGGTSTPPEGGRGVRILPRQQLRDAPPHGVADRSVRGRIRRSASRFGVHPSIWATAAAGCGPPRSLGCYVPLVRKLLAALGDEPSSYDAAQVREYVLATTAGGGRARAKSVANATRMFLRFLATYGRCLAGSRGHPDREANLSAVLARSAALRQQMPNCSLFLCRATSAVAFCIGRRSGSPAPCLQNPHPHAARPTEWVINRCAASSVQACHPIPAEPRRQRGAPLGRQRMRALDP